MSLVSLSTVHFFLTKYHGAFFLDQSMWVNKTTYVTGSEIGPAVSTDNARKSEFTANQCAFQCIDYVSEPPIIYSLCLSCCGTTVVVLISNKFAIATSDDTTRSDRGKWCR